MFTDMDAYNEWYNNDRAPRANLATETTTDGFVLARTQIITGDEKWPTLTLLWSTVKLKREPRGTFTRLN